MLLCLAGGEEEVQTVQDCRGDHDDRRHVCQFCLLTVCCFECVVEKRLAHVDWVCFCFVQFFFLFISQAEVGNDTTISFPLFNEQLECAVIGSRHLNCNSSF